MTQQNYGNIPPHIANQLQQLDNMLNQIGMQIKKLTDILKSQKLTPQQYQQASSQLQNLQLQYQIIQQNKQALLKNNGIKIPTQVKTTKSKSISGKNVVFGCLGFLGIFIILIGGIFFLLIKNPNSLKSMGISTATAKSILQFFSVMGFGILFLFGMLVFISNFYKLFVSKYTKKIKLLFASLVGFLVMMFSFVIGYQTMNFISKNFKSTQHISANVVDFYANFKGNKILYTQQIPTIAPMTFSAKLNLNIFNQKIYPQLDNPDPKSIKLTLDCGNGEKLNLNMKNFYFQSYCLYTAKGEYKPTLLVEYTNTKTQQKYNKSYNLNTTINIKSQINLDVNNKQGIKLNSNKNEIILGKVPVKLYFDSKNVFQDFNLPEYKILIDFDGDGNFDKKDITNATYIYKKAKLYYLTYQIPQLGDKVFYFPIRVEPSDIPICDINIQKLEGAVYKFKTNFENIGNDEIIGGMFQILDQNGKIIDNLQANGDKINYTFKKSGIFSVKYKFSTKEGKQGYCETEDFNVQAQNKSNIKYKIYYKLPNKDYQLVKDGDKNIKIENNEFIFQIQPPIQIKLILDTASSANNNVTKKLFINQKPILPIQDNIFEFNLSKVQQYNIKIKISTNGVTIAQTGFKINFKNFDIIPKVKISPDTAGIEPFTVKFDASTTQLFDPDDEIVYFSRNFGDGKSEKNISKSIITHTYVYDYKNENGTYYPVLTLTTKKGKKITYKLPNPIIVKKKPKTLKIHIDSHPSQIAKIGDVVKFSLEFDGYPKKIIWDFGNGDTLQCKGRECIETSKIYNKAGDYNVKAKIIDENGETIENSIALKVIN